MDATNSFFPMDLGTMPMQTDGLNGLPTANPQSQSPQQNNANAFSGNSGSNVFMGVSNLSPEMLSTLR